MSAPARTPPAALGALALLLAASCALLREPPPAAPVELSLEHYAGTSLTGPLPEVELEPAPAWRVTWRVRELAAVPSDAVPLSARAELVVVETGGDPLETRTRLGSRIGILRNDAPAPPAPERAWNDGGLAALHAGTTFALAARPESARGDALGLARATLELSRFAAGDAGRPEAAGPAELTLVLEGRVEPEGEDADGPPRTRRERVVVDLPVGPGAAPARLAVPLVSAGALLFEFGVDVAETAEEDAAFARARDGARELLEASAERVRERADEPAPRHLENESALAALARPRLRRSALVFLAGGVGAPLAGDLALVAETEELGGYVRALRESLTVDSADGVDAMAWALESTAFRWLASRSGEDSGLAPELRGLLLRRAGELASYPDLLVEALAAAENVPSLEERLVRENRIFLEDGRPAARVRAYDWLAARGLEPEGFDPLASRDERRAVLRALEAELAEPSEEEAP